MTSHPSRIFVRELSYFNDRAGGLVAVVRDGLPNALEQVRQWHPAWRAASDTAIQQAAFSLDDARLVYAQQHGFATWHALADFLKQLPADAEGEPFLAVFEAARRGNWNKANAVLRAHPDVVLAYGTNGNTLLNLASSLLACPAKSASADNSNVDRLSALQLLLNAGADVSAANDRGWTPLHQAAYRNDAEMAQQFLKAGAHVDRIAHGAGGTPLAVALFWGHREVAAAIAKVAVAPNNLRIAAGLDRDDLVQTCFNTDGALTSAAVSNRGFYRPHSGFPWWRPSDSRTEILNEALVWAAKSDSTNVMATLLAHGAEIEGQPYRGTALVWAAANGRVNALQWLLDAGANVNTLTTFGGLTHGNGVTALHLAAQNNQVNAVRLLLDRGADPTITDANYRSTPRGWAEHEGATQALAQFEQ